MDAGERRRGRRVPVQLRTSYRLTNPGRETLATLSRDVGLGGVSLLLDQVLQSGTALTVELHLPSLDRPVRAEGRIVWQRPATAPWRLAGVVFTDLGDDDHLRLARFLEMAATSTAEHVTQRAIAQLQRSQVAATEAEGLQCTIFQTTCARIGAIGSYLPRQVVTNEDLIRAGFDTTDKAIQKAIGAAQRRAAAQEESNTSMLVRIAKQLLADAQCDPLALDRIICSTDPQDTVAPNTAAMVQQQVGAHCPAFDIQMSCAGWLCGVDFALHCLQAGEQRILVLASAIVGSRLYFKNLMHRAIFGDGAAGILLEATEQSEPITIGLWTEGQYFDKIYVPLSWSQRPSTIPKEYHDSFFMTANQQVFFSAMDRYLVPFCERLMAAAEVTRDDIDHFLLHQPSRPLFERSLKLLQVPRAKAFDLFADYGNLVAAEMPAYLAHGVQTGRIQPGDRVLLLAYGAGFTMGGMIFRY